MKIVLDYFLTDEQKKDRVKASYMAVLSKIKSDYSIEPEEVGRQLKEFIEHCPEVHHVMDGDGNSLLHLAAGFNRKDYKMELAVVSAIVDSGADLYTKNSKGLTAMQLVFELEKMHLVNYLSRVIQDRASSELLESIKSGDLDGILSAVKKGANVNTCLNYAHNRNTVVLVDKYSLKIDDSSDHQINSVHLACAAGRSDIVKILMDAGGQQCASHVVKFGAGGNSSACSAYGIAIKKGDVECLKALIKNSDQSTLNAALKDAVKDRSEVDQAPIIRILIDHGADIHATNYEGKEILSYARPGMNQMVKEYAEMVAEQRSLDSNIKDGLDEDRTLRF